MVNVGDVVRVSAEGVVEWVNPDAPDKFTLETEYGNKLSFGYVNGFNVEVLEPSHALPTEPGSQVTIESSWGRENVLYTLSKNGMWFNGGICYGPKVIESTSWELVD